MKKVSAKKKAQPMTPVELLGRPKISARRGSKKAVVVIPGAGSL
jgi:hypothetical protein